MLLHDHSLPPQLLAQLFISNYYSLALLPHQSGVASSHILILNWIPLDVSLPRTSITRSPCSPHLHTKPTTCYIPVSCFWNRDGSISIWIILQPPALLLRLHQSMEDRSVGMSSATQCFINCVALTYSWLLRKNTSACLMVLSHPLFHLLIVVVVLFTALYHCMIALLLLLIQSSHCSYRHAGEDWCSSLLFSLDS
jgi:hypothetical protein